MAANETTTPFDDDLFDAGNGSDAFNWSTSDPPTADDVTGWNDLDYVLLLANATENSSAAFGNDSGGAATSGGVFLSIDTVAMVIEAVILGILILTTVIGNVFVIAAILLERNLQNVANFLILSLAVADLMVACLVMPLGAVYEVSKEWILGPELCDMWTSSDVLCCTASILHLVAIAVDRYWAVTNVDYIHQRNSKRIGSMIVTVWVVSLVVSLAPVLGWKDPDFHERISQKRCLISQDIAYQLFATMATFYVPLIVILLLYWRIFQAARRRIRRKVRSSAAVVVVAAPPKALAAGGRRCSETTAFTSLASSSGATISVVNVSPEKSSSANGSMSQASDMSRMEMLLPPHRKDKHKSGGGTSGSKESSAESKREKKAAKTLAIITGAFVMCWLPFFVVALLLPLCGDGFLPDHLISFFLWLGYFNSTLNPIIYTIFSPEFRFAFRRILFGRRRAGGYRSKR